MIDDGNEELVPATTYLVRVWRKPKRRRSSTSVKSHHTVIDRTHHSHHSRSHQPHLVLDHRRAPTVDQTCRLRDVTFDRESE